MSSQDSIFISYRRSDSAYATVAIYDRLVSKFGRERVFKDVDDIPLGVDFAEHLAREVSKCALVLVIVGKTWITVTESDGTRRLDNPDDFVRIEIEAALQRNIPVIPVLLDRVSMPKRTQLPESLKPFARRNATSVEAAPKFHADVDRLIKGIEAWMRSVDIDSKLITEKDKRIQSLENLVSEAIKSDKFYIKPHHDLGNLPQESPAVREILILTANPQGTTQRRLEAEVREIQAGLARAKRRDQFEIIETWIESAQDLRRALLDYEPRIVHFSGLGLDNQGLALEKETGKGELITTSALASLFELFKDTVECVFLSACYSAEQAAAISQHIPYVIGSNHAIGDRAALKFAVGFYDALGAERSIEDAFQFGCNSLDLEGLPASLIPILKKGSRPRP